MDEWGAVSPAPVAIHPADVYMYTDERTAKMFNRPAPFVKRKPDMLLKEGDTFSFGTLTLEVLHTPGHTPGGVCLVSRPYCVFSGDTLFHRSIGRTDLEGGSFEQIEKSIREKLYKLEDDLVVFPGHGKQTTIIEERYENPFVTIEEESSGNYLCCRYRLCRPGVADQFDSYEHLSDLCRHSSLED